MCEPDLWQTPEWALASFEALTGLSVVVHDIAPPALAPYLPPERFKHRAPCCLAVKAGRDWACYDFEVTRLRREIAGWPGGRYHRCHAGLMEWVMPVVVDGRLAWMLFAGQARTTGSYHGLVRDIRHTPRPRAAARLPAAGERRADTVLEAMRQLRSRLLGWHRDMAALSGQDNTVGVTGRRHAIQSFLVDRHTGPVRLGELARHLSLSESRTSHAVRELFGSSYAQVLQRLRLRTAAALLRGTSLSVLEVCLQSGFRDLSHFHEVFRRRFGTTPLRYRKSANP